jgi:rare lipoprotein A
MKSRNELVRYAACVVLTAFVGTVTFAQTAHLPVAQTGPAADYPVVIGAPFVVDGVTYTPADTMNYDSVGYAVTGTAGGAGITLAHRTLPLPSYVEVTSLKTGKTILVRAERRGPMAGNGLIELSPGAAAQLGAGQREPVRVRRVNPPEPERALLRTGQRAPARMDTPMPLVGVLMRRLEPNAPPPIAAAPAPTAAPIAAVAKPSTPAKPVAPTKPPIGPAKPPLAAKPAAPNPLPAPSPAPAVASAKPVAPARKPAAVAPAKPAPKGAFVVQVGAFANAASAARVAGKIDGKVSSAGKLNRVRIGTFATEAEASAALAKAKAAGYTDARIQRAD